MKLRINKVLFAGIALILFLVLLFVYVLQYNSIGKRIEENQVDIVERYIDSVNDKLEVSFAEMDAISEKVIYSLLTSNMIDWKADDFSQTNAKLKRKTGELLYYICNLNNLYKYAVRLYNSEGRYIYLGSDYGNGQLDGLPVDRLFWAHDAIERNGAPYITTPYRDSNTNNQSKVSLVRAVSNLYKVDKTIIFIDVQIQESRLLEFIRDSVPNFLQDKHEMIVMDDDGRILYDNRFLDGADALLRPLMVSRGTVNSLSFDGRRYVALCGSMAKYGFKTFVIVPERDWTVSRNYIIGNNIISIFFVFLLILLAVYIQTTMTTRSLTRLSDEMTRLNIDDVSHRHYLVTANSRIHEVNRLTVVINTLMEKTYDSVSAAYEAQIRETQAELKALQLMVDPHFLFNSLGVIKILAKREGGENTVRAVECLAEMMYYLSDLQKKNVTIREEMLCVNNYVHLMRLRKTGGLCMDIQLPEEMNDVIVPKLCIQPIVENCFKNTSAAGEIRITITGACSEDRWTMEISDNGNGFSDAAAERLRRMMQEFDQEAKLQDPRIGGFSLVNIYSRLRLMYGEDALMAFGNLAQSGAYVRIGGRRNA